jgi:8-oxo-dGTP pyrophosphatase MutT (NUDIX family)
MGKKDAWVSIRSCYPINLRIEMTAAPTDKTAIRDAATIIVLRDRFKDPSILMGQRGSKAAFMPDKFVFPGGAVDSGDGDIPLAAAVGDPCHGRLAEQAQDGFQNALAAAAIRELWEESGLILGRRGDWANTPPFDWVDYADAGFVPDASALQYVFRALTPPGRTRRFDARFFLVDADAISGDLDDFSSASDELSHLQWVKLGEVRKLNLPFITEVVLAEIAARVADPNPPQSVPYFRNSEEESLFVRLYGRPQDR